MRKECIGVAALPMYDWPELHTETNQFWNSLRDSLRESGLPAPDTLDRDLTAHAIWRRDDLVLAQTCGLPYATELSDVVSLVGTPAYDIDCGAGSYYSVIVVHADSPAHSINDLTGLRAAFNSENSQSGYAALAHAFGNIGAAGDPFLTGTRTGSHRASIACVADGSADFAAIDAVTWKIAQRHEKSAGDLRVLALTDPTPGLPFICANRVDWKPDRIHLAVVEAMAALDEDTRQALLLTGFAHTIPSDYNVIRTRHEMSQSIRS